MASDAPTLAPVGYATSGPAAAPDGGSCSPGAVDGCYDPALSRTLHIAAFFIILVCSSLGVWLPFVAGEYSLVSKVESNVFLALKAFGAGVILATGFVHMFPDAMSSFTNPCLTSIGWTDYPYAAVIAVVTVIVVLLLEHLVALFYERRLRTNPPRPQAPLPNAACIEEGQAGAPHDEKALAQREDARIRSFAIAQVLETGIAFHSILIGIALGVSSSPCTIRPLLAALCFHQFFEGVALSSCLLQADFRGWAFAFMAAIFALTTPIGVAIGIGIEASFNENSLQNLVVSGVFDSISTGILIYMSLVDLVAVDFNSDRFRSSLRLQITSYACLTLGAAVMCVLAIWA